MVSMFRRSTSRFFACTLLHMGSCSPRAGAALAPGVQGSRLLPGCSWEAGMESW